MVNIPRSQRGFTLLEGIIALGVLTSLLVIGSQYTQRQLEASLQQSAAAHLRRITTAAGHYMQDHYDELGSEEEKATWEQEEEAKQKKEAQPPLPAQTPRSLEAWRYVQFIKQGYLPTPDGQNCYGQAYAFYIPTLAGHPKPKKKQLLVLTTGGRAIGTGALLSVARQIGGHAGYITKKPLNTIMGSQRGWQLPLPAETLYQPAGRPPAATPEPEQYETPGHLATVQTIDPDDILNTDNLLHRTAQPNKPQRNRMETDLAMQRHQIIFTAPGAKATLSTQGLQLRHNQKKLDMGWDHPSGDARIVLEDPHGSVVMNATRVTTTGQPTINGYSIQGYSAPELQAYWNKVPYYELSSITEPKRAGEDRQNFANGVCLKTSAANEIPLGRLFMLGHEKGETTRLYLCSHGASPAQIIGQFPPESGAASPSGSPSSCSSSRMPAKSPRSVIVLHPRHRGNSDKATHDD